MTLEVRQVRLKLVGPATLGVGSEGLLVASL
jgi:hypothetical protein